MDAPKSHTHSPMLVNPLDMILSLVPNTTYIMNLVVQEGGHEFERLTQAFLGAILWRLIEALASEELSFLPIP